MGPWSFKPSYRDLVAMMGERSLGLAHTTILRWVQHSTPEFEKRRSAGAGSPAPWADPGGWMRPIRVRGEWVTCLSVIEASDGSAVLNVYRPDISLPGVSSREICHEGLDTCRI